MPLLDIINSVVSSQPNHQLIKKGELYKPHNARKIGTTYALIYLVLIL